MRRALYFLELRRALWPALSIALTATIMLLVLEQALVVRWKENPTTAWNAIQVILLVGIAASGLFAGARIFSGEFKTQHYPLLSLLPLPSVTSWCVLVLAGLSASAIAAAAILVLRPALVAEETAATLFGYASFAHLYLFAVGACFSLAFQRWFLVPVVGLPVAAAVLYETVCLRLVAYSTPLPRVTSPALISGLVFFFSGSLVLYARGEFDLPRTRIRQIVALFGSLILLVLLTHLVLPSPLVALPLWVHEPWTSPVSSDGRFVKLESRNPIGGVSVRFASGESGEPLSKWSGVDLRRAVWAPGEDAVWIDTVDDPLFRLVALLVPPAPVLRKIGVDGEERSSVRLSGTEILDFVPLEGGSVLAIVGDGLTSRIEVVGGAAAPRVLASGGDPEDAIALRISGGRAFLVLGAGPKARGWIYGPAGLEPLETVPREQGAERSGMRVVGRRLFVTNAQAEAELERLHPRPDAIVDGEYVADRPVCDAQTSVFFLERLPGERARLRFWRRDQERWAVVVDQAVVARSGQTLDVDAGRGLVLYQVAGEAGGDLYLFDASLNRSIPLAREEATISFADIRTGTATGAFVSWRVRKGTPANHRYYEIGSAIPRIPGGDGRFDGWPLALHQDGSVLIDAGDGPIILRPDGARRPVRFR